MSMLDGIMGALGGGLDPASLGARVGLSEDQVRQGLAALTQALAEHGDTVQAAAARTGLPLDKLHGLLAALGGESALSAATGAAGSGGLGATLGGLFGR